MVRESDPWSPSPSRIRVEGEKRWKMPSCHSRTAGSPKTQHAVVRCTSGMCSKMGASMPIYPISCQGTPAEQKTFSDIRSAIMGLGGKAILQPVQGSSSQTLQFTQLKQRGPCNSTANIYILVKAVFTTKRKQLRTDSSAVSTITPRRSSPHALVTGTVTSAVILTLMKGTHSPVILTLMK